MAHLFARHRNLLWVFWVGVTAGKRITTTDHHRDAEDTEKGEKKHGKSGKKRKKEEKQKKRRPQITQITGLRR
jgi:hypothetical protein